MSTRIVCDLCHNDIPPRARCVRFDRVALDGERTYARQVTHLCEACAEPEHARLQSLSLRLLPEGLLRPRQGIE